MGKVVTRSSAPMELLSAGKSVEQELDGAPDRPILGALVDLRRALWVPIEQSANVCAACCLPGMRKKTRGASAASCWSQVAAELALAMELDEERRRALRRAARDLRGNTRFLDALANSGPTDAVLTRLVESCTDAGTEGAGLGAVFAMLRGRVRRLGFPYRQAPDERARPRCDVRIQPLG